MDNKHLLLAPVNRLLNSERSKWIFAIGLIAIGVGLTAKNVISYPTECITEEMASIRNSQKLAYVYQLYEDEE